MLDDHLPLNNAGIPTIDIIDFDYPFWHKADDLPKNCSANSLAEVGKVVTAWLAQPRRRRALIDPPLMGEIRHRHGPFWHGRWPVEERLLIFAGIVAIGAIAVTTLFGRMERKVVPGKERTRRATGHALLGLREFIEPSVEYVFQAQNVEQKEEEDDEGLGGDEEAIRSDLALALEPVAGRSRGGPASPLGRRAGGDGLEGALRTGSSRRASRTAVPGTVPSTGLSRCTEGNIARVSHGIAHARHPRPRRASEGDHVKRIISATRLRVSTNAGIDSGTRTIGDSHPRLLSSVTPVCR